MAAQQKPDTKRGEMAFIFAIVLGLLLGLFIKRIKIGIIIGLVLGLLIIFTGLLRSSRK
jgi:F0F1-type ATP synthase assembly protein I